MKQRRSTRAYRPTSAVSASKRLGQHFLTAPWAARVLQQLEPVASDAVFEIGPGRGAVTRLLAPLVRTLVAVEIDRGLCAELEASLAPGVHLLQGDILALDLKASLDTHFPGAPAIRVVGNLPYNISSPILFRLLALRAETSRLTDATLMLQREVADRLTAPRGTRAYGVLSLLVAVHADVRPLMSLPPAAFHPAPRVHSSLVRLAFRRPRVPPTQQSRFEWLVRTAFTQRRKTILNALKPAAASIGVDPAGALREVGIDPGLRPEALGVDEFLGLARHFGGER